MLIYPTAWPDPQRAAMARSMHAVSSLAQVAAAVAAATDQHQLFYVERFASGYRWSLAHAGGPYPLLRIVARFLRVDYHQLIVSARSVDGVCVWAPRRPGRPLARAVLRFDDPTAPAAVRGRIRAALAPK